MFAEKFSQFRVRDLQNNTRMNIRNQDYAKEKEKRDRAKNYWQNNVIQNHLPPIDIKKKLEMDALKRQTSSVSKKNVSRQISIANRNKERMSSYEPHIPDHDGTENSYIDDFSSRGLMSGNRITSNKIKKELTDT